MRGRRRRGARRPRFLRHRSGIFLSNLRAGKGAQHQLRRWTPCTKRNLIFSQTDDGANKNNNIHYVDRKGYPAPLLYKLSYSGHKCSMRK